MSEIKYTIYKLIDPTSNEIRYIGLTFNSLKQRLRSHRNEKSKSHKCNWIMSLKKQGLSPIIESIEENIDSYEKACEREIHYIDFYKNICDLTNHSSGGNKNKKMSHETREKMRQSQLNRYKNFKLILSDSTKQKISNSTKLRMQIPEEINKLRISNKKYEDSKTNDQKLYDILIQNPKTVYQYDKEMNFIKKYPSIRNAIKETGYSNIGKCCNHKVVCVGGYVWRFEGDLTPPIFKRKKRTQ